MPPIRPRSPYAWAPTRSATPASSIRSARSASLATIPRARSRLSSCARPRCARSMTIFMITGGAVLRRDRLRRSQCASPRPANMQQERTEHPASSFTGLASTNPIQSMPRMRGDRAPSIGLGHEPFPAAKALQKGFTPSAPRRRSRCRSSAHRLRRGSHPPRAARTRRHMPSAPAALTCLPCAAPPARPSVVAISRSRSGRASTCAHVSHERREVHPITCSSRARASAGIDPQRHHAPSRRQSARARRETIDSDHATMLRLARELRRSRSSISRRTKPRYDDFLAYIGGESVDYIAELIAANTGPVATAPSSCRDRRRWAAISEDLPHDAPARRAAARLDRMLHGIADCSSSTPGAGRGADGEPARARLHRRNTVSIPTEGSASISCSRSTRTIRASTSLAAT